MQFFIKAPITLLGFVLLFSSTVFAAPLTWHLQDVTLTNGGEATGSFVFDAATGMYSAMGIMTPTQTYSFLNTDTIFNTASSFSFLTDNTPGAGEPSFWVQLMSPLTDAGGTVGIQLLITSLETVCELSCASFVAFVNPITGGSVTTLNTPVPEPATILLLSSGLLGLAGYRWQQRRREGI